MADANSDGSLTLDNASVQRLMDYGLLHRMDDGWFVGRWPKTNDRAAEEARQPQLPSDDGLIKALEEAMLDFKTGGMDAGGTIAALERIAREALSKHKAPLSVAGDEAQPLISGEEGSVIKGSAALHSKQEGEG